MSVSKQKADFLQSPAAAKFKEELLKMAASSKYNTCSSYVRSTPEHPDNQISFAEKHLQYIANHPDTDPAHYLANLKLKTRII